MNIDPMDRGLPEVLTCEMAVLGAILYRGTDYFETVSAVLGKSDFMLRKHQVIWNRMGGLQESNMPIDLITVSTELMRYTEIESVDGLGYLSELRNNYSGDSLEGYCKLIREAASKRRAIAICQHTMNRLLENNEEAETIITSAVSDLQSIETDGGEPEWQTATDIIQQFPGGWQALVSPSANGNQSGVALPWPRVQSVVCGMQKGEVIMLAGRPGMGKSAMAMQIAMFAADQQGIGVAYVSLEMTGSALVRREVAQTARVDATKMKLGYLGPNERMRLVDARARIENIPFHLEAKQRRGRTVSAILASLRYLAARKPIGLVVIDHFHLIDGPEREERIKYNRIADAIQRGARDMQVPFLVLAQLNRKCEEDRREPGMPDLKECGKIEENADVVMFIHRPEMYSQNRDREELRGLADLIIAKQRDGVTGKAALSFIKEQMRFESGTEDPEGHVQ